MKRIKIRKVTPVEQNTVDSDRLVKLTETVTVVSCFIKGDLRIETRGGGDFQGTAFYLDDMHEWKLGKDDEGATILVPLTKG